VHRTHSPSLCADSKVNVGQVPNYRTGSAGTAAGGAGAWKACFPACCGNPPNFCCSVGLSSVITQTDASGQPVAAAPAPGKRAYSNTQARDGEVRAPTGWRRFCCFTCGKTAEEPAPYLSNVRATPHALPWPTLGSPRLCCQEFDSIDIDYDEVAVLRSARPRPLLPPPPVTHKGRKCLVLDLDETLVHSSFKVRGRPGDGCSWCESPTAHGICWLHQPIPDPDFIIPVEIEGVYHHVYVAKRPGCDMFLERMGKLYEIVVFTASLAKYANPLLDQLDVSKVITTRLFREACVLYQGKYVKDLALMGRDLRHTIIVDNSPCSYLFHPENAIGCER